MPLLLPLHDPVLYWCSCGQPPQLEHDAQTLPPERYCPAGHAMASHLNPLLSLSHVPALVWPEGQGSNLFSHSSQCATTFKLVLIEHVPVAYWKVPQLAWGQGVHAVLA